MANIKANKTTVTFATTSYYDQRHQSNNNGNRSRTATAAAKPAFEQQMNHGSTMQKPHNKINNALAMSLVNTMAAAALVMVVVASSEEH